MKFIASSTVLVTVLSLLTSSVEAANKHAGTRRQLDLHDGPTHTVRQVLQKRLPLGGSLPADIQVGPKLRMLRRSSAMQKREPAPEAGFGAVPMMNDGTGHIVGLVQKRDDKIYAHNGQQGIAVSASTSNNGSGISNATASSPNASDDGDDEEDCDDEEDEGEGDDGDCDGEDDDDDEDEDCDEDDEDASADTTSSDSDSASATSTQSAAGVGITASVAGISANINVNLKASSTSSSASSQSTQASSSASKGIATWYTQNGVAGACGKVNPDSAHIIALYTSVYGSGSNCGRTVEIQNLDDGTSTTAVVADECPSCGGPEDIDLSVGTFSAIDPEYQTHGVRNIKWWFTS